MTKVFWLVIFLNASWGNEIEQIGPFSSLSQCQSAKLALLSEKWYGDKDRENRWLGYYAREKYTCIQGVR